MTDSEKERNEAMRRNVIERMWLNYYNNEPLAQGLMHHKMKVDISMCNTVNRTRHTRALALG